MGTLCAQLFLQFYADCFETCFGHDPKMCKYFGYDCKILFFFLFFLKLSLVAFCVNCEA